MADVAATGSVSGDAAAQAQIETPGEPAPTGVQRHKVGRALQVAAVRVVFFFGADEAIVVRVQQRHHALAPRRVERALADVEVHTVVIEMVAAVRAWYAGQIIPPYRYSGYRVGKSTIVI